jgi:HAD superfamily hydrolase (TIGR01509 family)
MIQAVIFDLDGVLIDSEWLSFQVWQELIASRGGRLDAAAYPGLIGLTAEETAFRLRRQTGVDLEAAESIAWIWEEVTRRISQGVEPLPGGRELVQALDQRGFPLAIASNSPSGYIENALAGLGMHQYFRAYVGVDMVTQGKPEPEVYLEAARRLGADPRRCLAIEDSRVGVQAALNAGMRVLAVPAEQDGYSHFQSAWAIYKNLDEIHAALDEILG